MSSITDLPIQTLSQDLLKIDKYASALSKFITQSDTPITVGLQGEWGTGKTSLMSILCEQLTNNGIATSWVNTWEYSLFRNNSETTPAILRGMLEKLEDSCKKQGNWDISDNVGKQVKNVSRFLSKVANQVVTKQTGINIADAAASGGSEAENLVDISAVKSDISSIIDKLISSSGNPYTKVVFFVDDLDRIPPSDAVEVLEALKNIFDIPQCIFVLAIDYDVVVKGLEEKFGPKTDENEREFRSFFDKIIQVPFSMPTGTYSIESFLEDKLSNIGFNIPATDIEYYSKVVRLTVGTNPRSLKRYLNSFALINQVRAISDEHDDPNTNLMLFALLGIQISYPFIFRMITKHPDFTAWNSAFCNKEGVNLEQMREQLSLYGESELLDEEWEQVTWSLCQRDSYLKSRSFDMLSLFNLLRDKFKDELLDKVEAALEFAAITSVDDDAAGKQATTKVGHKTVFSGLAPKLEQMRSDNLHPDGIAAFEALLAEPFELSNSDDRFKVSIAKTGSAFYNDSKQSRGDKQLLYVCNPAKKSSGFRFVVKGNSGLRESITAHILSLLDVSTLAETEFLKHTGDDDKLDLRIEASLAEALGHEAYLNLLRHISNSICAHHK